MLIYETRIKYCNTRKVSTLNSQGLWVLIKKQLLMKILLKLGDVINSIKLPTADLLFSCISYHLMKSCDIKVENVSIFPLKTEF